jgi:hypothetical protein
MICLNIENNVGSTDFSEKYVTDKKPGKMKTSKLARQT